MTKFSTLLLTATLGSVVLTASAADPAVAAGDLAEIASLSVQSKSALTDAALAGDVDAIAEAGKRSDAVDAAMAQAQEAFLAMERAMENGDQDVADSAAEDLKASLESAVDAFNGVIPEEVQQAIDQWKNDRKNTGTKGRPYDPVNVYDVPWDSASMRDFYQNQFANFWESGLSPQDRETTPE